MAATKDQVTAFLADLRKSTKNIPIIGKHVARMGRVHQIISQPCGDRPFMFLSYVASAPDALLFGLVTLFKPTHTDYMVSRFGRGHRGGGPRPKKYNKRQTDLYKGLNRIFNLQPFRAQNGLQAIMLRSVEILRLVGWYLTIVEAISGGLVRWVSQAYEMNGCPIPPLHSIDADVVPDTVILFQGAWLPLVEWDTVGQTGYPPGTTFGGTWPVSRTNAYNVQFEATAREPDIPNWPASTYEFRLLFLFGSSGVQEPEQIQFFRKNDDGTQTTIVVTENPFFGGGPTGVICQYKITGSGAGIVTHGTFTYTDSENLNKLKPDP